MNYRSLIQKYSKIKLFLFLTLLLLGFSAFYIFYYRLRRQTEVFVRVSVLRSSQIQNAPATWLYYWEGNSIEVGGEDVGPTGWVNAKVVDKETYEGRYNGQSVFLLSQVNAIRDRSGVYLFKNKPLTVGSIIDLKLTKAQVRGVVTYVGLEPPHYEYKKLIVVVKGREVNPWQAESINVGSTILTSKGQVLAKVLDKKVTPAEVRVDTTAGSAAVSYDRTKRDIELTVELLTKKVGDNYYYMETEKIKVGEQLFLPLKEIDLILPIVSINEIKETGS